MKKRFTDEQIIATLWRVLHRYHGRF